MLTTLSLVAALFCPSPTEQQSSPRTAGLELLPASNPQYAGVYHPSYGFRPAKNVERSGPVLIYNNMDLTSYYSIPGTDQEWIDEGQFLSRHSDLSEQVNGTSFIYCSAEDAPNGITSVFRLYDETIICAGPPAWPAADCSYALAGLPGGSNGNLACWQVDLDLSGFECNLTTDPSGNQLFGFSHT